MPTAHTCTVVRGIPYAPGKDGISFTGPAGRDRRDLLGALILN